MHFNHNLRRYLFVIIAVWTLIVGGSFYWNLLHEKDSMESLAKKDAVANFNKDMAFRFWASKHGGVYVKKNERTPSNPNLSHIPERDVVTPSGTQLTLMNPAYMLRQIMSEFPDEYGVKGRIVSDRPLWKPNKADEWEMKALEGFKRGDKEKFELTMYNEEPYLRLMRPMITEKSCLKCHAAQGYKVGDVRGGVGVMVKMAPYMERYYQTLIYFAVSYFVIYGAGLLLILFGGKKLNGYLMRLDEEQQKVQLSHVALELKVQERTQELKEAYEKVKELDNLKTMFIAAMSHELRTPLNSIIGFSGLLMQQLEGPFNERQIDHLSRINKTGKHLFSLITDVMDVSQIEAGYIHTEIEPFMLDETIAEMVKSVTPKAEEKGIAIVVEIPQGLQLQSDKKRLEQCVLNYLKNAVSYSEKGTVTLRAYEEDNSVVIEVEDEGIGISQEDQQKIFQPFERIDSPLSVKAGGTGLGLYLTRKIVTELFGGTVGVISTLGKGSKFWLKLPKQSPVEAESKGSSR